MAINSSQQLGETLGKMNQEQSETKSNISANEQDANAFIFTQEQVTWVGCATATKWTYGTTSFILDHPVYGDLDSSTLELDGGYAGSETQTFPATFPWSFEIGGASEVVSSQCF